MLSVSLDLVKKACMEKAGLEARFCTMEKQDNGSGFPYTYNLKLNGKSYSLRVFSEEVEEKCFARQGPSSTLPIIPWLKPPTHILFQKQAPAQSARKSFPENVRGDKIKKTQKYSVPANRSVFLYGNFTILPF